MTDADDSLVRRLRQFQADEPGFPPLFSKAADQIEAMQREILRCDDACYGRDREIAALKTSLLKVRNWLDVQFNEPFKNSELAEHIGLINDVLHPPLSRSP